MSLKEDGCPKHYEYSVEIAKLNKDGEYKLGYLVLSFCNKIEKTVFSPLCKSRNHTKCKILNSTPKQS